MNLVLSGPIDANLRNAIVSWADPLGIVRLKERACRFELAAASADVRAKISSACELAKVDHAYVEANLTLSDFRVLAMDMDSTLITVECIDEIADFVGKKDAVAAITSAAMLGEIASFSESLIQRVRLLTGTPLALLERVYRERVALSPGAESLLNSAKSARLYLLLVSGGFTYFTDQLKDRLGFDAAQSNQLIVENGILTGEVRSPILDALGKADTVQTALDATSSQGSQALVVGDGANDLAMMALTPYSVAYHAKPAVNERARWRIQFGGLDVLLDYLDATP